MKMNHKYELMAIISSRITDGEITKRLKGLKEFLGNEIVFEELWGMRPFAFPIKKQDKGYYAVWNFMADSELVQDLEKNLKLYPDLLRFLISRVPNDYTPMPLEKIEAGLEELRKQKAEKRGGRSGGTAPRPASAPTAAVSAVQPKEVKAEKPNVSADQPPEKKEVVSEEDTGKKKRSFDEKLEDILSNDDLGL